jgi:O-acetyl-ADP-ribose deacetylase (regulator of RNase III)
MSAAATNPKIVEKVGDITREDVDAIVNAANSSLLGGGGVDGAIHRAGGPSILVECRRIRETQYPQGLPTGEAVITTGGLLVAKHVIHTVGPIYGQCGGAEALLLANCYENSIVLAARHSLETIAFPAISTGVYGYPKDEAREVALAAVTRALERWPAIREVRLVSFR